MYKIGDFVCLKSDIKYTLDTLKEREVGIVVSVTEKTIFIDLIAKNIQIGMNPEDLIVFDPQKTGDLFEYKVCNTCHVLKETSEFEKNQNGKDNRSVRRPTCRTCRKDINGLNAKSSEKKPFIENKPKLEKFTCPICEKTTIPELTSKVVLDHDHSKGKIRGWICDSCNTGLGRFKDDVSILQNAIDYLSKHKV